jgi:chitin disaccharide deacetylase
MTTRRTFIKNTSALALGSMVPFNFNFDNEKPRLIFRADDMGMCHAANLACIESYKKGIVRSVEVMVPCGWFLEAADMLNDNKGFDAGLHLTLTSEWDNYRWRPLTHGKSLLDEDKYFHKGYEWPEDKSLLVNHWDMDEVETELRAQIELGLKKIPHLSHFSDHMYFSKMNKKIDGLLWKLAKEYNLHYVNDDNLIRVKGKGKPGNSMQEKVDHFKDTYSGLQAGIYWNLTHPQAKTEEGYAIGPPERKVGEGRYQGLQLMIHPEVVDFCKKNVQLISYKDYYDGK